MSFADLVNEGMAHKRTPEGRPWSDYTLSAAIGLLSGDKSFNAKQVWRLRRGERQSLTRELVERLIEILDLDPAEAWAAAGLLPPGFTAEHLRRLDFFASAASAARDERAVAAVATVATVGAGALKGQSVKHQGHVKRLGQLIPFPVERRLATVATGRLAAVR